MLILLAYAFDLSSQKTKIPTVILLLVLGWLIQLSVNTFELQIPDLKIMLPVLGTVGLILIVLEGGLDLEVNSSKLKEVKLASISAFFPMIILMLLIGFGISQYCQVSLTQGIINAIPVCIISSAIAIPSVHHLASKQREFVVYESSFSDIIGVVLFNFFTAHEIISIWGVGEFIFQFAVISVISIIASIGLAYLIKKIDHHVKFLPVIVMIILVYSISKIFHLPALIFILIFGLALNNLDELKQFSLIQRLEPEKLDIEVKKFKELVVEFAFLVRTLFFLLFGYTINATELLNVDSLLAAFGMLLLIIFVRMVFFKYYKIPLNPLLFVSPRGLITILLFLSIPETAKIPFINETLMVQMILLSAFLMMFGLMFTSTPKIENHDS